MSTNIRPAEDRDAGFISWVELAAARSHLPIGFFDLAFPGDEQARLALIEKVCTIGTASMCHWSGFLVAEVDGTPAAALSGYEPTKRGNETFANAMYDGLGEAGWSRADVDAAFGRMTPFLKCSHDTPDDAWVVEWVATKPEYRGRGLIRSLMHEILEEGRRRDYHHAQISLLIGNDPAQRAYESAGFVVDGDKTHPEFEMTLGSPGIRRMVRDL